MIAASISKLIKGFETRPLRPPSNKMGDPFSLASRAAQAIRLMPRAYGSRIANVAAAIPDAEQTRFPTCESQKKIGACVFNEVMAQERQ
jgi:hypothetical protein